MPIREIIEPPNERLHAKCKKVDPNKVMSDEIQALIDDLLDTKQDTDGVGIAAPQIDVLKRIIVVDVETGFPQAFINPKIISKSFIKTDSEEGCLSIPGVSGIVRRHKKVKVRALDRDGKAVKINASGLASIIFQHEIDHLNGILFTDDERLIRYTTPPSM